MLNTSEVSSIQSYNNELKVRLNLNKFEFVVNGASTQRTDKIERIKHLERRLYKEKISLLRKQDNSNNSKKNQERIQKILNRIDNIYSDYINKCISEIVKSCPTCVVVEELKISNNTTVSRKNVEFKKKLKRKCRIYGIMLRLQRRNLN
ncbi:transposase [uncultured Catenibacterium sp.]|uniref:transposase n=1 Tax=uncultured Catenibacterium sp. TaxID=286142 RepID=UPI0025E90966|nr:transposase [uncultured Catenibacterium sp.]